MYKWTRAQREELQQIADGCKELGAKIECLAPLYAAIYPKVGPLTKRDIAIGQQVWEKL